MLQAQETNFGNGPTSIEGAAAPLRLGSGMSNATLAEVAHEARNMVAALGLYCELLEGPGVLTGPYQHYSAELKLVAAASTSLVSRLQALSSVQAGDALPNIDATLSDGILAGTSGPGKQPKVSLYWQELPTTSVQNFVWELQANRNLLAAVAGPSVALTIDAVGGEQPVSMTSEDLTRILVNLVKNAVEAMPATGGRIQIILRECQIASETQKHLLLNVEDNGVGFVDDALEHLFEAGYTTHSKTPPAGELPRADHRGLGLSITRSIVEASGGRIRAANRDPVGACIQIELPVRDSVK